MFLALDGGIRTHFHQPGGIAFGAHEMAAHQSRFFTMAMSLTAKRSISGATMAYWLLLPFVLPQAAAAAWQGMINYWLEGIHCSQDDLF